VISNHVSPRGLKLQLTAIGPHKASPLQLSVSIRFNNSVLSPLTELISKKPMQMIYTLTTSVDVTFMSDPTRKGRSKGFTKFLDDSKNQYRSTYVLV